MTSSPSSIISAAKLGTRTSVLNALLAFTLTRKESAARFHRFAVNSTEQKECAWIAIKDIKSLKVFANWIPKLIMAAPNGVVTMSVSNVPEDGG